MWNRAEVKAKGKTAFKRNYWTCVIVALIGSLLVAGGSSHVQINIDSQQITPSVEEIKASLSPMLVAAGIVMFVLSIFILNVLEVGCRRFFLMNLFQNGKFSELKFGFNNDYVRNVATMLVKDLLIAIGLILFIIPGIVMYYQYRMVPYVLSEKPELTVGEVLSCSKEMMKGNKMATFIYDLSFLGWWILAGCTLGILGLFYVNPYKFSSDAELYVTIRSKEIQAENRTASYAPSYEPGEGNASANESNSPRMNDPFSK